MIGKAKKGTMCSVSQSGGVNNDHSHHPLAVASTVAHEMGHLFGMDHDDKSKCKCAAPDRCIMEAMTG